MDCFLSVPCIDQREAWPTGCESVSAVMLLWHLGLQLSVDDFIEQYLPMTPMQEADGILIGPDPRKSFAGNPEDPQSFGCYAPVIVQALDLAFQNMGMRYEARDLTGVSMEGLQECLRQGFPVIFWASLDLRKTIPGPDWLIPETGERFTWLSNEHCMLLVGYDDTYYYFNDPMHGTVAAYPRETVEARHREMYEMAVSAFPWGYAQLFPSLAMDACPSGAGSSTCCRKSPACRPS